MLTLLEDLVHSNTSVRPWTLLSGCQVLAADEYIKYKQEVLGRIHILSLDK
jgi:hypothetical protein